ncbi:hypothetical protein KUF54_03405 [Comamonas sp. Y33R10-2]|uniref:hypothetical protein n=1 Tax=Comamonas sp. Y33R10-2 TaxID=2853257 RepID=UPI001C5C953F|nr:hypothetical protein [Comamonas sp. Y33R10-2]QXZ10313.1 hypothetical protein KUF54_03405 [Comamonas sp. Y33R10-2]
MQSISPSQASEDWPYPDYPPLLPKLSLKLASAYEESWMQFSRRLPNLPEGQTATLVAIVPEPRSIGHSLWGEAGDDEAVCVVCECDLAKGLIRSYNICS